MFLKLEQEKRQVFEKLLPKNYFHRKLFLIDFLTLKAKTGFDAFLSNAIIDLSLSLKSIKHKDITCISRIGSSSIFNNNNLTYSSYIPEKLSASVIFPIHKNGNHWIIAVAHLDLKKFSLIDPYGATKETQEYYFEKFINFINFYKSTTTSNFDVNG